MSTRNKSIDTVTERDGMCEGGGNGRRIMEYACGAALCSNPIPVATLMFVYGYVRDESGITPERHVLTFLFSPR